MSLLVVALAALVLAGLTGLVVLTRMSAAGEGEFWKKIEQLARLRKESPFDVVFTGHSIPFCAIDPEEVRQVSGLKTYNASLSTLFFGAARVWMTRLVLPTLQPRYVVVGLAGVEFNPNSTRAQYIERYIEAQDARTRFELGGIATRVRLLATRPELVRYLLRRLAGRASEPLPPPEDRSRLGPLGDERKHDERTLRMTDRFHEALRDGIFNSYEFAESEVDQLRGLVHEVRAAGSEVIVLRLVMLPAVYEYFPNGEADYKDAWDRLHPVLDELAVPLLEIDPSPFDESCFSDIAHMNRKGKLRFSRDVGVALAARLGVEHASK